MRWAERRKREIMVEMLTKVEMSNWEVAGCREQEGGVGIELREAVEDRGVDQSNGLRRGTQKPAH